MAQHGFHQFGNANAANIDPNDLAMNSGYSPSFSNNNNFNSGSANAPNGFSSGSAVFGDDELLDGLASPSDGQGGMHGQGGQDFPGMNMGFSQGAFQSHRGSGLQIDPNHINGFSNTPDGDPIQSPYAAGFNAQFRQMQGNHGIGNALHSPLSYSGSPLAGGEMGADGSDPNYLNAKARARMSAQQMQRKASNNRNPMTPQDQQHARDSYWLPRLSRLRRPAHAPFGQPRQVPVWSVGEHANRQHSGVLQLRLLFPDAAGHGSHQ